MKTSSLSKIMPPDCPRLMDPILPDAFQRILEKTREQRIPFSAHWELTYRCNLACVHCYATDRHRPGELTPAESLRVLDELARAGCLFLCLTGGEIFCRADLIPLLRAAKSSGFALRLLTNGTLLTPELADALAEIQPLAVEISLYAMDPVVHEAITTVAGSHGRTLAALRLCRERGLNTAVKTVLLTSNAAEYSALRAFAGEIGARFVYDLLLAPSDQGEAVMDRHGLSEDDLVRFFRAHGRPPPAEAAVRPDPAEPVCGQAASTVAISPSGDVFPCLAIRRPMGNLRDRPFRDIWLGSGLVSYADIRYLNLKECDACPVFDGCIRCPGLAWAETGNLTGCSRAARRVARAHRRAWGGDREIGS
jgi:radical SAM protein with 4Fe4S-binding SPASM domain